MIDLSYNHVNDRDMCIMAIYGYARVSTLEQNLEQQIALLKSTGFNFDKIFSEKVSAKNTTDREQWQKLMDSLKPQDQIVTQSIDRLGRCTRDVLDLIDRCKSDGIKIFIADLGSIDITSATGQLVVTTLSAVAQMQREQMLEKQFIGIERAKAEGKYKGKQQTQSTINKCIEALKYVEKGMSKEKAAKAAGIGVATLYRYIKQTNHE